MNPDVPRWLRRPATAALVANLLGISPEQGAQVLDVEVKLATGELPTAQIAMALTRDQLARLTDLICHPPGVDVRAERRSEEGALFPTTPGIIGPLDVKPPGGTLGEALAREPDVLDKLLDKLLGRRQP